MPISHAVLPAVAIASLAGAAHAQLTPDRLYYGVNRSIPMTVAAPAGAEGEVEIGLFTMGEPGSAMEQKEKASAAAGRVDLAGLFPVLWTTTTPKAMYAQLIVGGKRIGAPVVLQPLLNQEYASVNAANPADRAIRWSGGDPTYSGLRAYVDRRVILDTSLGEVEIALRPDMAPNTCFAFLGLAEGGFYTDVIFHRVVPTLQDGNAFVVQAGDPAGKGSGGPGYMIDLERSTIPHDFGVISMARTGEPNSNGSQFFLCLSREGTARLDGQYCAFGHTVRGADTIAAIASTPIADERTGRPVTPPVIKSARTVPAPPVGEGPAPVKKEDAKNVSR